jgi:sulfonate transport system substrate-binding protein
MGVGDRPRRDGWRTPIALVAALMLVLAACGEDDADPDADGQAAPTDDETPDPDEGGEDVPEEFTELRAGFVSAIDQIGLPAALDQGFFDEEGLDVDIADPFATGVDMLNALESGEIDIAQVGVPAIGAIASGMDLVLLGNYTGSAVQLGIDETMAVVAREGSGIDEDDPSTIEGMSIGVSVGTISHLYLLGMLSDLGLSEGDVDIVNTDPPDMPVALETEGVDAIVVWDPWPIVATQDVEGAYEVSRGEGYIAFIGYIVAERDYVEQNPEAVESFLAARAKADAWMREHPDEAAATATRWLPGTAEEVALEAMEHNVQQLDPRISQCNYLALEDSQQRLADIDAIEETIDVDAAFEPDHILAVEDQYPEYFQDLEDVPEEAAIESGYEFSPEDAQCPA